MGPEVRRGDGQGEKQRTIQLTMALGYPEGLLRTASGNLPFDPPISYEKAVRYLAAREGPMTLAFPDLNSILPSKFQVDLPPSLKEKKGIQATGVLNPLVVSVEKGTGDYFMFPSWQITTKDWKRYFSGDGHWGPEAISYWQWIELYRGQEAAKTAVMTEELIEAVSKGLVKKYALRGVTKDQVRHFIVLSSLFRGLDFKTMADVGRRLTKGREGNWVGKFRQLPLEVMVREQFGHGVLGIAWQRLIEPLRELGFQASLANRELGEIATEIAEACLERDDDSDVCLYRALRMRIIDSVIKGEAFERVPFRRYLEKLSPDRDRADAHVLRQIEGVAYALSSLLEDDLLLRVLYRRGRLRDIQSFWKDILADYERLEESPLEYAYYFTEAKLAQNFLEKIVDLNSVTVAEFLGYADKQLGALVDKTRERLGEGIRRSAFGDREEAYNNQADGMIRQFKGLYRITRGILRLVPPNLLLAMANDRNLPADREYWLGDIVEFLLRSQLDKRVEQLRLVVTDSHALDGFFYF